MPTSPAPVLPNLVQAAHLMTVDELKWYVEAVADRTPTRKGELIVKYVAALTDVTVVQRLWNELTPLQRQVVTEVAYTDDGQFVIELLEAKYEGAKRPANPRGYMTYSWSFSAGSGRKKAEPYDVFFMFNGEYGVFMPRDLAAVVRDITPPPPPFELRSSEEPPSIPRPATMREPPEVFRSTTERAVLHDLAATLFLIQQGKVAISAATKAPTLATLRLLRQRLLVDEYLPEPAYERAEDAVRPFALVMLVQAARWAMPTSAGNKLELTKSGQALLPGPLGAQHVREAWERWLKTDLLDELGRIRAIKGQQAKGVRLTKPAERRQQIAASLRACPTERWIDLDDYLRFLRATAQLPDIERGNATALHLGSYAESGWLGYADVNYWDIVNGSYIRVFLWEYAATLGMVEIAYTWPDEAVHDFGHAYGMDEYEYLSRYDGLLGFRITALGAYVLGLAPQYTPPAELAETGPPVLTILPNLDVVVVDAPRLGMTDRAMLERIGVVQSTDVFRLQREHLLDALEHGLTLDQIKVFLATRSGTAPDAFPQTVQVFFQDVERRSTALRDGGRMVVVEGDDPLLLTELAYSSELRGSVQLATIGERTVLLVAEEREAAVRRGLRKLGYLARKG